MGDSGIIIIITCVCILQLSDNAILQAKVWAYIYIYISLDITM